MGVFTTNKQFQLGLNLTSQWWLSGASIDLDLDNGRYYDSSLSALKQPLAILTDYLSCSRASVGYAKTIAGGWTQFPNNVLRLTDRGLLIEEARTNYLLQSETPATQTTTSLATGSYTLWVEGSGSATPSAGSATITGAATATAANPNTFTVTVAGTVVVTVSGSLSRFQLENSLFASSYIPTLGVTATRAQDAVSTAGALSSIVNLGTASVYAEISKAPTDLTNNTAVLMRGVDSRAFQFPSVPYGNDLHVRMLDAAASSWLEHICAAGTGYQTASIFKMANAWAPAGRSITAQGGSADSDLVSMGTVTGDSRVGFDTAYISINTYLRRLAVWNSRLADATLQSLTAP